MESGLKGGRVYSRREDIVVMLDTRDFHTRDISLNSSAHSASLVMALLRL